MAQKRRILHKLKITEISAVDNPCQQDARVTIMKAKEGPASAMTTFDERVEAICKRDGCSPLAAMPKARKEYPADFARYQAAGMLFEKLGRNGVPSDDVVGNQPDATRDLPDETQDLTDAVRDFEDIVDRIIRDQKVSRTTAMTQARKKYPRVYMAYQAA